MVTSVGGYLELATAVLTSAGIIYNAVCTWSALKFIRKADGGSRDAAWTRPPVSILKPVRGTDPEMYESFRSFALLDFPQYEILFAVHDLNDPAAALVEKLKLEFPHRDIRLCVFPNVLGSNAKVSSLAQLAPLARYEHMVVNDGDIRVRSDYLQKIIPPLRDPAIGLVTCLYRGVADRTLGSRLEALGISTDFCAGVLMAQELEGEVRFGLGSTMAFRKADLDRIGGFEVLLDLLADDYELGARMCESGKRVYLADVIVETYLPAYGWRDFCRHQLRWARSIRDSRPWGYLGLAITYAIPWAMLGVVFAGGAAWAWALLAVALLSRWAVAFAVGVSVLSDHQVRRFWWLIPVRDCLALVLWAAAYAGRTVYWRGDKFILKNGRLTRVSQQKRNSSNL